MKPVQFIELGNGYYHYVNIHAPSQQGKMNVITTVQKALIEKIHSGISMDGLSEPEQRANKLMKQKGMLDQKEVTIAEYPNQMSFWVHLTNKCPMRCEYCHVYKENNSMETQVLDQLALQLIETAKEKKLRMINLRMAGGEPVLVFHQIKAWITDLEYALKALDCKLQIAFLSGLATLPKDFLSYLKDKKAGISVSLDGVGFYQDLSRPLANNSESFEKVEENILTLLQNGISPHILNVISDRNIDGLIDFTKWIIKHNLSVRFNFVKGEKLDREKVAKVLSQCYDLIEEAVLAGTYTKFAQHGLADISFNRPVSAPCGAGRSTGSIYVDGEIYLCQIDHDNGKAIGSIFDKTDILETMIHRDTQKNFISPGKNCSECSWFHHCASGCPYEQMDDGRSKNCGLFHLFIPRIYQIRGKQKLKQMLEPVKN